MWDKLKAHRLLCAWKQANHPKDIRIWGCVGISIIIRMDRQHHVDNICLSKYCHTSSSHYNKWTVCTLANDSCLISCAAAGQIIFQQNTNCSSQWQLLNGQCTQISINAHEVTHPEWVLSIAKSSPVFWDIFCHGLIGAAHSREDSHFTEADRRFFWTQTHSFIKYDCVASYSVSKFCLTSALSLNFDTCLMKFSVGKHPWV